MKRQKAADGLYFVTSDKARVFFIPAKDLRRYELVTSDVSGQEDKIDDCVVGAVGAGVAIGAAVLLGAGPVGAPAAAIIGGMAGVGYLVECEAASRSGGSAAGKSRSSSSEPSSKK